MSPLSMPSTLVRDSMGSTDLWDFFFFSIGRLSGRDHERILAIKSGYVHKAEKFQASKLRMGTWKYICSKLLPRWMHWTLNIIEWKEEICRSIWLTFEWRKVCALGWGHSTFGSVYHSIYSDEAFEIITFSFCCVGCFEYFCCCWFSFTSPSAKQIAFHKKGV